MDEVLLGDCAMRHLLMFELKANGTGPPPGKTMLKAGELKAT